MLEMRRANANPPQFALNPTTSMSRSPQNSTPQTSYDISAAPPPPPPPKPSTHSSGHGTPLSGPPLPPPPPGQAAQRYYDPSSEGYTMQQGQLSFQSGSAETLIPLPENGWLPESLRDKSTTDLQHVLSTPSLQSALVNAPSARHPAIPQSLETVRQLLDTNIGLATSLEQLEAQVIHQRSVTQARLLALRAQEQQYRAKIAETEAALRDFSPMALYQRLSAGVGEQDLLCKTIAESFLESDGDDGLEQGGVASERDITEFVKRIREARKTAYLRKERKERWDEGRVGGWR